MHSCSLGPMPEKSLSLFVKLLEDDPGCLNAYTFPPVFKACAAVNAVTEGTQIHGLCIKYGVVDDPYISNSLIHMYFACSRILNGQLLFDGMPERSIVSWNCVIGGYAELGLWEKVKYLFWLMVKEVAVEPNSITLVMMVTACTRSGDIDSAMRVHRYLKEKQVRICLKLANALMNMYAKFKEIEKAQRLFDQMRETDVISWTTLVSGYANAGLLGRAHKLFEEMPSRDIVAWNAMLADYVFNGCFQEAISLFTEMMVMDMKMDKATMLSVLSACSRIRDLHNGNAIHGFIFKSGIDLTLDLQNSLLCLYTKCRQMELARQLFDRMGNKNEISWTSMVEGYVLSGEKEVAFQTFDQIPEKDVVAWNALITALTQSNHHNEALHTFKIMQSVKVSPNCSTLVSTLSACARVGALELGKWIHSYIKWNKMEADSRLISALVDMYARCGCIELSVEVFNNLPTKDVLAWSTVIGGLAMNGRSKVALEYLKQMLEDNVQPDAITFIGVLTACSHAGLVEEGKHYFKLMRDVCGISPTVEHYVCMVDLLGRQGLLREGMELIEGISAPSNVISLWGALLGACKLHGDIELAEYAAKELLGLDQSHSGAYVMLSNIYAANLKWDEVRKIRKIMKDKGVEKTPGCSSIEVNGAVNEFFAWDTTHPQSKDIYMMLNVLDKAMEAT